MVSTNETNIHLWPTKSKVTKDSLLLDINKHTKVILDLRSLNVEDLKVILAWLKEPSSVSEEPQESRLKEPLVTYIKSYIRVANLNRLSIPTLKQFSKVIYEYANKSAT